VRFLDFVKVKESEREQARELFGTEEEPTALAAKVRTILLNSKLAAPKSNNYADPRHQDHQLQHLRRRLGSALQAFTNKAHRRRKEAITGAHQEGYQPAGDHCAGEGAQRGTSALWNSRRCYGGIILRMYELRTGRAGYG
jgi:hypothetical protein